MKLLDWILRIGLGGFFIGSGVVKLMDLQAFTEAVGNYQFGFLKEPGDAVVAYFLPWVEIFAGLAVISGFGKLGGLVTIMGMLVAFNIAIAVVWSQGLNINCGCFGESDEPTNYPLKLAANMGLFLVAAVLCFLGWRYRPVDQRLATAEGDDTVLA